MSKEITKGTATGSRFANSMKRIWLSRLSPVPAARDVKGLHDQRADAIRPPSHEEIARRAHEIYLSRGASPGQDLSDWLEAERQLWRSP